ncbi:hypothetical protein [Xylophilus sp. GOD-11R]|uniref:hypothetical protein n=1 Tax=Xylophilus sp. GOD-11R TaxID=3089814 RepID=UPI00298CB5F1|nr:hypothetical protein [Xylophilus sp. GOD-11R]WPB58829.1 hypothetical protein R9X41_09390 [Xylophilus sp. GOD-11R]
MTASIHFVLDAQTKAALPAFAHTPLDFSGDQPVPVIGDTISLAAVAAHSFVVKDRSFAYDQNGGVVVTVHLTLASERSV